ncbi:ABC transporter permease [Polymorphum gilvum]|uniref:Probable nitrate/sulfonate/bicarbonate ABC transporter, permease protein n=1 Tax=Polymorphum gilvum (strain LMG 25793 / CGMCC 1.9160 / SL003B-26A1) TaxID=991905 RepID=F2IWC4_POLGS|nr:ABC transporter permease [Polymorphum gilvum]ADZ69223.1 Probable nitrate/sulfonate/bicarbonate ABC transporter, permease protein [Polymorphum gilvum SL003B-26A1]
MTALDTEKGVDVTPAKLDEPAPIAPRAEGLGERLLKIAVPLTMLALLIVVWAWYVSAYDVPHYILPSPSRVLQSLIDDWGTLSGALLITLKITLTALGIALVGGVGIAILMAQSRWIELALYPYAVILQVTPIVAIAPLILIYAPTTQAALLICAWIVAFFPILSNTTQGLKSTDHNLLNLFELYGASRWQTLMLLKIPNALPYFLAGLRIAGGLALIAAVVAEFAAGSAGAQSGLAYRLLESQFRLNIPRLFAALILLSVTGVVIFFVTSLISHLLLRRWHESALKREN